MNAGELAHITSGRERQRRTSRRLGVLEAAVRASQHAAPCLMYFPNSFGFYFCITWLPDYMNGAARLRLGAARLLHGLPLILSVTADLSGGIATDIVHAPLRPASRPHRSGRHRVPRRRRRDVRRYDDIAPAAAAWCIAIAVAASMFTSAPHGGR